MLLFFILGCLFGGGIGWFFWWSAHREAVRLDEEKEHLKQEQTIVFDFMHNMVESIGEGVDRQKLLERIVHAAILSTGAMSACLFERVDNDLRGAAVEGLFPPHRPLPRETGKEATTRVQFLEKILKAEVFRVGEGLVGTVAKTGEGIFIRDARDDPRVIKHEDPALQVRSVIVVPVSFRDRNLAVLAIVNSSDGGSFTLTDFSLATSLAEQAGLAIHNLDTMSIQIEKSRLDNDLTLARDVQSMLLPRHFPDHPKLDIGASYRPAQKVGGDLYDFFDLGENRIGIAVADVSGKGVPASLMMTIALTNLRHLAQAHTSPAEVLRRLNERMYGELHEAMFITLLYAVIDLENETLTLARGGHELPIHISRGANGKFGSEMVSSNGMALALFPPELFDTEIEDRELSFHSGDLLLPYTDGVTEASNQEGEEFTHQRLARLLLEVRERSASEINQIILERVAQFSSQLRLADDFTLVAVKRTH